MSSQVLYRKWRPQTLSEVVGQEHVTKTLLNALKAGRVAHAYLFCGPRGTGKTSTGRILAKAVNCTEHGDGEPCNNCSMCQAVTEGHAMDVMEIDAASNRGIDEIRELRERVRFSPSEARFKVYIIDEVHMLTDAAANALLKTLEEPPPHVIFVLATTETHKVPLTVLSRCQRFDFRRIPQSVMAKRLAEICESEGLDIEGPSLNLISRSATGSMRDAENLLEQLAAQYGNKIDLAQVRAMLGITGDVRAHELARHIVDSDLTAGLQTIYSITQDGLDLNQFCRELVEYLRGLILLKGGADTAVDVPREILADMKAVAERATMPQLSEATKLFRGVEQDSDGFSPLPLELALVECTAKVKDERSAHQPLHHDKEDSPPKSETVVSKREQDDIKPPAPAKRESPPIDRKPEVVDSSKPAKPAEKTVPEPAADDVPAKDEDKPAVVAVAKDTCEALDIDAFRNRWGEVVRATKGMGSRGNLDALLRSACEPVSIGEDVLVLGFYYEFHKEKIEDPKYRHMVEAKVSEIFGKPYRIKCELIDKKPGAKGRLVEEALKMGATEIADEEENA